MAHNCPNRDLMPSSGVYEDTLFLTLAPTFKAYYSTIFARYRKMTIKEAKNKLNCHCPGQTIYCNQPISLLGSPPYLLNQKANLSQLGMYGGVLI